MARVKESHHGGAWKVAYADFVTAMMALFMVLWITSQDKEILLATSKYFKQPFHALTDQSIGVISGKGAGSSSNEKNRGTLSEPNLAFLHALAKELNRMLNISDALQNEQPVDMQVTSDGLKITIYDRSHRPIFEKGSTKFTDWGSFVMQNLAWLIERNKLKASIDGHAAKGTQMPDGDYGLWELTADRANAARRAIEQYGANPAQIQRVTGFADTQPLPGVPVDSEANQRITVSLVVNP
jgi:chemotaxis protein MotB